MNSLGGEWYTLVQLGGDSSFSTQWYQPLDIRQRFFVDASYSLSKKPIKLADDGQVLARFQNTQQRVTSAAGITLGNIAALKGGLFAEDNNADLETGSPEFSSISNFEVGTFAEFSLDTLDRPYFPAEGSSLRSEFVHGSTSLGGDTGFDSWKTSGFYATSIGKNTFAALGRWSEVDLDDELQSSIPSQLDSLGGLFQLSGHVRGSMSGNYLGLADLLYYRRPGGGQRLLPIDYPLYIGASFEAGNVWLDRSDASWSDLEYSSSIFLGARSPLGPLYFALGRTQDNDYAVYMQLGRLFD